MSFVTPALLAGALMMAVPIIMHLIMRRQPQHLEFPAIRFLKVKRDANRRRLRLRHLLLLALRVAAICLLAFALARPTIRGAGLLGGEEAPVTAVFLFDSAPRMDYRHQNQTRLEVAKTTAAWLLTQLPRESEVAIVDGHTAAPSFAIDSGAARQQVERLRIHAAARTVPQMLSSALGLLRERRESADDREQLRQEVYIFTDLTQSGWTTPSASHLKQQLEEASDVALYVIDVGVDDPQNFGLEEVRLSREVLAQNTPTTLTVDLHRIGPEARRSVELYLLDEQQRPRKRGEEVGEWNPEAAGQIEFQLSGLESGTQQGYVRIAGEDGLGWDDVRYFTLEVRPAWQVLVATPQPERAMFLTEALAPSAFRESGRSRFDCSVVALDKLAEQPLERYAAVCLLDPRPLPDDAWRQLADYARDGGSVAIFLGGGAVLDEFNKPAAQALLPGQLRRQSRDETYLEPRNFHHPLMAKFRPIESSIPWRAFPVYRYWQLGSLADGAGTIITYGSQDAAVLERPVGKGRVLTMTTPISDPANLRGREPWNLLPTGLEPWPFVMLANEMMLYLVGSQDERLNYLPGETAVFRHTQPGRAPLVLLTLPSGEQIRQTVDPRQDAMVITSTSQVGNYRVRAGGEAGGLDRGFSVNLDPPATRLERVSRDSLTELLGNDRFRIARNREEIDRDVNIGRVGKEIFPYLICLVALVLAAEHVLANRFYRRT